MPFFVMVKQVWQSHGGLTADMSHACAQISAWIWKQLHGNSELTVTQCSASLTSWAWQKCHVMAVNIKAWQKFPALLLLLSDFHYFESWCQLIGSTRFLPLNDFLRIFSLHCCEGMRFRKRDCEFVLLGGDEEDKIYRRVNSHPASLLAVHLLAVKKSHIEKITKKRMTG